MSSCFENHIPTIFTNYIYQLFLFKMARHCFSVCRVFSFHSKWFLTVMISVLSLVSPESWLLNDLINRHALNKDFFNFTFERFPRSENGQWNEQSNYFHFTTNCPALNADFISSVFKVVDGLYVGSIKDSRSEQQLLDNNITHMISVLDNVRKSPAVSQTKVR